jgi:hypothetical protein
MGDLFSPDTPGLAFKSDLVTGRDEFQGGK